MDICATSAGPFVAGDSNPGTVRMAPGGVGRNIAHNLALLGDQVRLVTIFGADGFGRMLKDSCKAAGLDLSLSQIVPGARNACFVSLNGCDGELLGGVADMAVTGLMTPDWLESRLGRINDSDVVVADTNLRADTLELLVACCLPPLYIDAVSSAKALRLREALSAPRLPGAGAINVKCNRLEAEVLGVKPHITEGVSVPSAISRLYVSLGSEGLQIVEDGTVTSFPALPVTGIVSATGAGDALFAGIIHAGPEASAQEALQLGLRCAKYAIECKDAVNPDLAKLIKR